MSFSIFIAISSLTFMTPILLASVGEIITEKSGVVNIGIEGILIASALAAALTAIVTGSLTLSLATAVLTGALIGFTHGAIAVYFRSDQIIAGLAVNIIAYGATVVSLASIWGAHGASPRLEVYTPALNVLGYKVPFISLASILIALIAWYALKKLRVGLALRACGEDPRAAEALGVNVNMARILATTIGGALAGLAGAFLAIEIVGQFTRGIAAGRGFIALANVAFSGWNPLLAIVGAYAFGFLEALSVYVQQHALEYAYIAKTIPYLGTLAIVALAGWKARMPRSLAKPYIKE
ncbi:MAG: ABC transporter permease [Thermoprotei archaeon]|nr:ABC transporter permease [Thermoprotei archaeon]